MKRIKIKFYQRFADFIVRKVENAKTKKEVNHWFNIGMGFNEYCISQDIYLN